MIFTRTVRTKARVEGDRSERAAQVEKPVAHGWACPRVFYFLFMDWGLVQVILMQCVSLY